MLVWKVKDLNYSCQLNWFSSTCTWRYWQPRSNGTLPKPLALGVQDWPGSIDRQHRDNTLWKWASVRPLLDRRPLRPHQFSSDIRRTDSDWQMGSLSKGQVTVKSFSRNVRHFHIKRLTSVGTTRRSTLKFLKGDLSGKENNRLFCFFRTRCNYYWYLERSNLGWRSSDQFSIATFAKVHEEINTNRYRSSPI